MDDVIGSRLVLRRDEWPLIDQQLFIAGMAEKDILDGESYGASLRPWTLRSSINGYGRFLAVMAATDPAILSLVPADRISPGNLRCYLRTLRECGNTNNTIKARFWELRAILRIMHPERDFSWINKPAGVSLHSSLPTRRHSVPMIGIGELTRWGHELMDQGLHQKCYNPEEFFRNGLMIAMLADRAPRQRSLSLLRIGHNIFLNGRCYRLAFTADETKGNRSLEYDLHPSLTPRIDHYLQVERPRLLGMQRHNWFWVGRHGERLKAIGIDSVLRRASKTRFGYSFGTHRFRYSLATAAMIANPTTPGLVAAVLGNSPAVTEKHYVLGGQVEAAKSLHSLLSRLRAED